MEALDVVCGVLELVDEFGRDLLVCGLDLIPGDRDAVEIDVIELLGELPDGLVSVLTDVLDDLPDGVLDLSDLGLAVLSPKVFVDFFPHAPCIEDFFFSASWWNHNRSLQRVL